jgi:hypothetical protein
MDRSKLIEMYASRSDLFETDLDGLEPDFILEHFEDLCLIEPLGIFDLGDEIVVGVSLETEMFLMDNLKAQEEIFRGIWPIKSSIVEHFILQDYRDVPRILPDIPMIARSSVNDAGPNPKEE